MSVRKGFDRRDFIKASALGLAGVGTTLAAKPASAGQASSGETPKIKSYRTLGRTGFKTSDIGV
ncbi:MAG: twin-arginine translocation signal domain-containing protein, partial [Candidatus Aminicenantes bacterium]|nr:twin-arginine translocation signal domain-containing protein [Candidatus Aminicenantes bacterium]